MLSKIVRNAGQKPMTAALLLNFFMWTSSLIRRYDGTFTFNLVPFISTGLAIAFTTLVTYAVFVVIAKAVKYAGSLLKRIPRARHRR